MRLRMLAPYLRVTAFVATLLGLSGGWLALRASAHVDELSTSLGAQMLLYARARSEHAPRTLHINGAQLQLRSFTTTDSAAQVLDHLEQRCRARDGMRADANVRAGTAQSRASALLDGVIRSGDELDGTVACLDTGSDALSFEQLITRLRSALDTGDISQLGGLRFTYARSFAEADTFGVSLWSDGALPLRAMFPAHGDAPGADPLEVPRPPASRRLLHVVDGQGQLWAYAATTDDLGTQAREYREHLSGLGFVLTDPTSAEHAEQVQPFVATRGGEAFAITIAKRDGGRVLTTLIRIN